jgi:tetratricopeptide (TPR) repeat protein
MRQFGKASDHTVLMMGIVSRRVNKLARADSYFQALIASDEAQRSISTVATALHHLAWLRMDQGLYDQAEPLARLSYHYYLEIKDPRGASDVEEQLGELLRRIGDVQESIPYLRHCIKVRENLQNKVGIASASRRLSKSYKLGKQYLHWAWYLGKSFYLYVRLHMMTFTRIKRWLRQP